MNRRLASLSILVYLGLAPQLFAATAEPVILTIDGKTGSGTAINFTRSDLERLGMETVRTSTPWHNGVETFEGVKLAKLMESVDAQGHQLFVVALNNYTTEIPMSDVVSNGPILALKRDGKYMEIEDKGPLFVVYPFDSRPELNSELFYSRSAWQVRSIAIE